VRPFDQNPAFADEKLPRVYAGVAGGAVFPDAFDTSLEIDIGGAKVTASADMHFDDGQAVGGLVGYAVTQRIAIEAELGHATFDMNRLEYALRQPQPGVLRILVSEAWLRPPSRAAPPASSSASSRSGWRRPEAGTAGHPPPA